MLKKCVHRADWAKLAVRGPEHGEGLGDSELVVLAALYDKTKPVWAGGGSEERDVVAAGLLETERLATCDLGAELSLDGSVQSMIPCVYGTGAWVDDGIRPVVEETPLLHG